MRGFIGRPPIYFGTPGELLELPWPLGGLNASYDRPTFDFITGSGAHRVSKLDQGARSYGVNWTMLHQSTFDLLNAFYVGANGVGPWALIDPSRPNLLTPNQAAAGGVFRTSNDFLVINNNSGLSAYSTAQSARFGGTGSIRFQPYYANAGTATFTSPQPIMNLDPPYAPWAGIPVVPGKFYTFSYLAMVDYMTGATTQPYIDWCDASFNVMSTTFGPTVSVTPGGGWKNVVMTVQAPANAIFMALRLFGPGLMVSNGNFEVNTAGWSVLSTSGAIAQDTAQHFTGTGSMRVTPNGTSASTLVAFQNIPVVAGQKYNLNYAVWTSVSHTTGVGMNIIWLNAGGGTISTSTHNLGTPTLSTWNSGFQFGVTAPAGAVNAQILFHIDGTPAATHIFFVDAVYFAPGDNSGLYCDAFQLEYGQIQNDWAPGTGVRPVSIVDFNEDVPIDGWFRQSPSAVMQEVI